MRSEGVDVLPVEDYTAERRAEFLLSNAVDEVDYAWAVVEVRKMGLDPAAVTHRRPLEQRECAGSAVPRGRA